MVAARTRFSSQPIDTDCRFWSPTSPPSLHSLLSMTSSPSVFYWWDTTRAQCLPCSRCKASLVTLQPCTILSDTKCGAREKVDQMLGLTAGGMDGETDYWDGAGELREFSRPGNDGREREDQEEVWGRQRLREGAGSEVEGARLLLREGLVDRGGKMVQSGAGAESQFGRPSFYTSKDQEVGRKEHGARPILDIMRQFLRKNITEKPWRAGKRGGRGRVRGSRRTTSTTTTTTTTTTATTPETTTEEVWSWQPAQFNNAFEREFNNEPEDELYRDENYESEQTKYEIETENDFGIEHDEVEEVVSSTISPGDAAIRELFHMIESGRENLETAVEQVPEHITFLQQLLIAASSILVLLVLALVLLLLKRGGAQADVERKLSGEVGKTSSGKRKQPPQHLTSSTSLQTVPSAVARSLRNIRREQDGAASETVRDLNSDLESENFRSSPLPRAIAVDVRGVTRLA